MRSLGQQTITGVRDYAGTGYIILPPDLDREEYIAHCYRTGTVSIIVEGGFDVNHRVRIGQIALQLIKFPIESNELGSCVAWINMPKYEEPIVVEVLVNQREVEDQQEDTINLKKSTSDSASSLTLTKDGKFLVNVRSNEDGEAVIDIKSVSKEESGFINIFSNGNLKLKSTKNTINEAGENFSVKLSHPETEDTTELSVTKTGFVLSSNSESDNLINVKSNGQVKIQGTNDDDSEFSEVLIENGKVTTTSEEIIHNSGAEPMVLGDTLAKKIDKILDILLNAKTATAIGLVPLDPKSLADLTTLKTELIEFKSKKSKLE